MPVCAKCGHQFDIGRFCTNCGHPLNAPVEADAGLDFWRTDTVEVCVVDDGIPTNRGDLGRSHLDAATGVEHDVDDFDDAGICQWW